MKITFFFLIGIHVCLCGQVDTTYIEEISRNRTIQIHTTAQDFAVKVSGIDEENAEFRINNLSSGFYFKFGLAELFVALPITAFDSRAYNSDKSFGTGFGLNIHKDRFHINYNFKYVQGFESISQVRADGVGLLNDYNHFIFNRLNTHYIFNEEKYSLRAALRFNDRQKKTAGTWLLGVPISYHLTSIKNSALESFGRLSVGAMGGYAYSYVVGQWSTSIIAKAGVDVRYSQFEQRRTVLLRPSTNLIISSVYNVGHSFVGASYYSYPEYDYGEDVNVRVTNWKLRLYVGKRFF